MRVVAEAFEELPHVLVHIGVERDFVHELVILLLGRQLTVAKQPRDLEEGGILRELLYRVAAIAEDSLLAIDERDGAPARCGVQKRRVVAHETRIVGISRLDLLEVDGADRAISDRDAICLGGAGVLYFERASRRGCGGSTRGGLRGVLVGGSGWL